MDGGQAGCGNDYEDSQMGVEGRMGDLHQEHTMDEKLLSNCSQHKICPVFSQLNRTRVQPETSLQTRIS